MKEVIAVIRNEKWQATRLALESLDVQQVIHRRVLGRGRQQGLRYLKRGSDSGEGGMAFIGKRMVVCIASDDALRDVVERIIEVNRTGNVGDGKIFVRPVEVAGSLDAQQIARTRVPAAL
jgi:nitrogen regulatory protein PII 2